MSFNLASRSKKDHVMSLVKEGLVIIKMNSNVIWTLDVPWLCGRNATFQCGMEEPSSVTTVLSQYNISAYVCDSSAVGCILVLHFNSAKESDSTELKCSTLGGSTAVITRLTSEACHSLTSSQPSLVQFICRRIKACFFEGEYVSNSGSLLGSGSQFI